ncbi:MAG: peptidylprolyl isomerase [Ignavibacteriae bacterium]|nr:peptidylprolyl isomerase [Ignavibacteriota bacterium]MCB9214690.1 peptidylprolyl isomerase [Ignavibacteria bacterium]
MGNSDNVKKISSIGTLFLLLFALSLFINIPTLSAQKKEGGAVAIVNGVEIPYVSYDRARLTRLLNLGANPDDTAALDPLEDDGIFLTLVDSELLLQEAKKRGVSVSRDEAIELLIAKPPEYILEIFEGGKYQPSQLRKLVKEPETILLYASRPGVSKSKIVSDWEGDVNNLLRYYSVEESRRRLLNLLYQQKPLTQSQIRNRYFAEKTILSGSVVRVLHSTVPDSATPVTEAEARAWFNDRRDEYAIPESRLPLAIILPIHPSAADSAVQREQMEKVKNIVESTPISNRSEKVANLLRDLPPNRIQEGRMISPASFPGEISRDLVHAKVGDLLGPYPTESESLFLYVAAEAPSTDTIIRARHILLRTGGDGEIETESLLAFMRELRDSIDSEEEFMTSARVYSVDDMSAQIDGDLGYAARGLFVPEFDSALFSAPVGKVVGPIQTRFGYHLIWVNERVAKDFQLRELRFPLHPSPEVVQKVKADAEMYAEALRSGEPTDQLLPKIVASYPSVVVDSMTYLKRLEPYADGLVVGEFLFRTDVGDVGVLPLPFNRVAIVKQTAYWPGGTPTYEEIPQYPIAHVRRKKQLDILEKKLSDFSSTITPTTLLGPIREVAPMAEILGVRQRLIPVMEDEDPHLLDTLVTVTKIGEVSGPIRGIHALYFLRVSDRFGPDETAYRKEIASFSEQYQSRYRQQLLDDLLKSARANSQIKDLRNSTLIMLGSSHP